MLLQIVILLFPFLPPPTDNIQLISASFVPVSHLSSIVSMSPHLRLLHHSEQYVCVCVCIHERRDEFAFDNQLINSHATCFVRNHCRCRQILYMPDCNSRNSNSCCCHLIANLKPYTLFPSSPLVGSLIHLHSFIH